MAPGCKSWGPPFAICTWLILAAPIWRGPTSCRGRPSRFFTRATPPPTTRWSTGFSPVPFTYTRWTSWATRERAPSPTFPPATGGPARPFWAGVCTDAPSGRLLRRCGAGQTDCAAPPAGGSGRSPGGHGHSNRSALGADTMPAPLIPCRLACNPHHVGQASLCPSPRRRWMPTP